MESRSRHEQAIEQAFSRQAAAFEDTRGNRAFTTDAEWLFERLQLEPGHLVLDVAAGTGHAARSLALRVRTVVALDATAAMLAAGKAEADQAGLTNVVFQRGDAAALPFLDASFDVVVSRFAVHHFEAPALPVGEMVRCVRPGGQLALADMVADERPAVAATQNRLERLRDPSHTELLTALGLTGLLSAAGVDGVTVEARSVTRPLEPWLAHAGVSEAVAADIRSELLAEARGGPETGLRPREEEDGLWFEQRFASAVGIRRRPAAEPAARPEGGAA